LDEKDVVERGPDDPAYVMESSRLQADEHNAKNQNIEHRIELEGPAHCEPAEMDSSAFLEFREEKARNEEAADDEEEVHACPTGANQQIFPPGSWGTEVHGMRHEHSQDCGAPKNVQLRIPFIHCVERTRRVKIASPRVRLRSMLFG